MPLTVTITIADDTEAMWGIQYARQEANRNNVQRTPNVEAQNEQIVAQNLKLLPQFQQPLIPVPALLTDEEFITQKFNEVVNQLASTVVAAKERQLVAFAKALPPEALAALIAQAGVPDLIK